jgi:hypothetical protein
MLNKLQKYQQAKQEYETAKAEFNRGLEAVTAELRKLHHLDSLREEVELWRGWVDADALLAHDQTGDKTVFSEGGFVVTVAVTEKPVVTDAEAVFAAIDAAKLSANLAERKLKLRPFGKWAKTQRDIGAEVPGVEFQESKSVRVTLPKATEQEAAE